MKVKIIALVLLMALLAIPVGAITQVTEEDLHESFERDSKEEAARQLPATIMNYAIIAIIAIVIIAGGVYLGLKMYNKNHPPADNTEKK